MLRLPLAQKSVGKLMSIAQLVITQLMLKFLRLPTLMQIVTISVITTAVTYMKHSISAMQKCSRLWTVHFTLTVLKLKQTQVNRSPEFMKVNIYLEVTLKLPDIYGYLATLLLTLTVIHGI